MDSTYNKNAIEEEIIECLNGTIPVLICKRCNWNWFPRANRLPQVCPKCKSPYWNKERRRND